MVSARRRLQAVAQHVVAGSSTATAIDCWIDTDLAILTGEVDDGMCVRPKAHCAAWH